jgi:hypothetical protein
MIVAKKKVELRELLVSDIAAFQLGGSTARKLNRAYRGSAISVFENGGNTLVGIGFNDNLVDNLAITTHVGVNSGYINTLYDQSGNSLDWFYNSETGERPLIVDAGALIKDASGRAVAKFIADKSQLRGTQFDLDDRSVNPSTVFIKLKFNTSGTSNSRVFSAETNSGAFNRLLLRWTSSPASAGSPQFRVSNTNPLYFTYVETEILITILFDADSSLVRVNGVQVASGSTGSGLYSAYCLGAAFTGETNNAARFQITDFIHYSSDQSTNFEAIEAILNS